ncbi:MAG: type II toxin-antitoxin system prevent-host-death family antitoxin [Arachnia sp.]
MSDTVSVRDLRNHGGTIIDAVSHGGSVVVTKDGVPVAELRALAREPLSTRELMRRRRSLPHVDPGQMRTDIDELLDSTL